MGTFLLHELLKENQYDDESYEDIQKIVPEYIDNATIDEQAAVMGEITVMRSDMDELYMEKGSKIFKTGKRRAGGLLERT